MEGVLPLVIDVVIWAGVRMGGPLAVKMEVV